MKQTPKRLGSISLQGAIEKSDSNIGNNEVFKAPNLIFIFGAPISISP